MAPLQFAASIFQFQIQVDFSKSSLLPLHPIPYHLPSHILFTQELEFHINDSIYCQDRHLYSSRCVMASEYYKS